MIGEIEMCLKWNYFKTWIRIKFWHKILFHWWAKTFFLGEEKKQIPNSLPKQENEISQLFPDHFRKIIFNILVEYGTGGVVKIVLLKNTEMFQLQMT